MDKSSKIKSLQNRIAANMEQLKTLAGFAAFGMRNAETVREQELIVADNMLCRLKLSMLA